MGVGNLTAVEGWQGERSSLSSDPSRPHVDAKGLVSRSSEMQRPAHVEADKTGSFSSSSTDQDAAGTKNEKHKTSPGPASPTLRAPSYSAHPSTGAATLDAASSTVQPLKGQFSMRGELMHAFICYRLATEGPMGNGRPPAQCFSALEATQGQMDGFFSQLPYKRLL